jgi:hypothetical protein
MARTPEMDAAFIGWLRFSGNAEGATGITRRGDTAAPVRTGAGIYTTALSRPVDILDVKISPNIEQGAAALSVRVASLTDSSYEIRVVDDAGVATDAFTISVGFERLPQPSQTT